PARDRGDEDAAPCRRPDRWPHRRAGRANRRAGGTGRAARPDRTRGGRRIVNRDPDTLADCFDLTRSPGATDEHRQLRDALRRFVDGELAPHAAAWDEAGEFPRELYRQAAQVGLLGLGYPAEFGGTPCDTLARIIATIELTRSGSGGLIASLMSHTIMLGPLLKAGGPA